MKWRDLLIRLALAALVLPLALLWGRPMWRAYLGVDFLELRVRIIEQSLAPRPTPKIQRIEPHGKPTDRCPGDFT